MTANEAARDLLEAVAGYADQPTNGYTPSADRAVLIGTVDAAYSGTGNAKVLFDGESVAGSRTYVVLEPVSPGDRVLLIPVGRSYVIAGKLGGGSFWGVAARNRNRVQNGNFRTNQIGFASGTAAASTAATFDRWASAGVINLETNPRFEAATTGWSAYNASTQAKSSAQSHSASNSLAITRTGTGDDYAVKAYTTGVGLPYTFSAWVYKTANGATNLSRGVFVTDSGAGYPFVGYSSNVGVWERISISFIATTASTQIRLYAMTGATIYYDDIMFTQGTAAHGSFSGADADCAWSGTADASTSQRGPASTTLTFTADPHGQPVTISSGGGIVQIIERADADAGTYTLSWSGTATARVYNVNTLPASIPALAASPLTVTLDGLDDVVVELRAVGAARTVSAIQLELGIVPTPFERIPLQQELALCQRHYHRYDKGYAFAMGVQTTTTGGRCTLLVSPPLRARPTTAWQNLWWADLVAFNAIVSGFNLYKPSVGPGSSEMFDANVTFAANGAAYRPGALAIQDGATNSWLDLDARLY